MPSVWSQFKGSASVLRSGEGVARRVESHHIPAATDYPQELVSLLAQKLQSRGMGEVFSRRIALLLVRDGSQYTLDEISLILHECLGDAELQQSNKQVMDTVWRNLPTR